MYSHIRYKLNRMYMLYVSMLHFHDIESWQNSNHADFNYFLWRDNLQNNTQMCQYFYDYTYFGYLARITWTLWILFIELSEQQLNIMAIYTHTHTHLDTNYTQQNHNAAGGTPKHRLITYTLLSLFVVC